MATPIPNIRFQDSLRLRWQPVSLSHLQPSDPASCPHVVESSGAGDWTLDIEMIFDS